MKALDQQVGGQHYKGFPIQPTEYWKANHLNGDEAVIVKYVTRWREKGGVGDLRKARHHLQFILEDELYQGNVQRLCHSTNGWAFARDRITPAQYSKANNLPKEEAGVVLHITIWQHTGARQELESTMKWMEELIAKAMGESA